MSFPHSLAIALFFVCLPLEPSGAKCPWGITYDLILRDFSSNIGDVCRSEMATIRFVQKRSPSACCAFDLKTCENAKEIYEYFYKEMKENPVLHSTCYYNFFLMFYNLCGCQKKIHDKYPIILSTTPPVRPPTTIPTIDRSCGLVKSPLPRIVGGERSLPCEFPWMVRFAAGDYLCGGTIIDTKHVVTAAHCVVLARDKPMYVTVSTTDHMHGLNIGIKSILKHPSYNGNNGGFYNDVAILTLAEELSFTNCIQPICLPRGTHDVFSNTQNCYTAGWGKDGSGSIQRYLRKVRVPLMGSETCKRYVRGYQAGLLCAGYLRGGKDACAGDSGGPLMCQSQGQWVLAGVVSFGFKCAQAYNPGVYTDVRYHLNWIVNNLH